MNAGTLHSWFALKSEIQDKHMHKAGTLTLFGNTRESLENGSLYWHITELNEC